ncbi:Uncharacterized protein APZ42_008892, partial [Daphnia magna]
TSDIPPTTLDCVLGEESNNTIPIRTETCEHSAVLECNCDKLVLLTIIHQLEVKLKSALQEVAEKTSIINTRTEERNNAIHQLLRTQRPNHFPRT